MFTKTDIEKYFTGEKQESFLFILVGIAALITAVVFFFLLKQKFYTGAAIPLLLVALIMILVGYTVYKRSDDDRKRNVYAYDMNPTELKEKELPRMDKVMKNFVVLRYSEIVLLLAGVILFFIFRLNAEREFWKGFGLSLAVMAAIALAADTTAELRGKKYTTGLRSFVNR